MNRILFAGLSSGSGKTAVTCACLRALQKKGISAAAFKCGPDYIDPMFHQRVLGIPGENLDLFFADAKTLQRQIACYEQRCKIAVLEGVMGYYDGLGGVSDRDSTWDVACATNTPVILVVRPKGASLTIAAQVQGMLSFRKRNQLAGILLNDCSEMMARLLAPMLEEQTGLPVVGFLPHVEDASFESRHLGLVTAQEVGALSEKIDRLADAFLEHVDLERLLQIAATADAAGENAEQKDNTATAVSVGENAEQKDNTVTPNGAEKAGAPTDRAAASRAAGVAEPARQNRSAAVQVSTPAARQLRIGIAQDTAFCFYYEENKRALRQQGLELVEFSPMEDKKLPEGICGLYLGGGYPELHAGKLSENSGMRHAIFQAVRHGMPTIAECGGFLYLQKELEDADGQVWEMTGVLDGSGFRTNRLQRFGYAVMTAKENSMLFEEGESIPVHEFHYWDCTQNGTAFLAAKPVGNRKWECGVATASLYAGFPHLYFLAQPKLAERFARAAADWQDRQNR